MLQRPIELAQYLAIRYTERLAPTGAVASVGSKGDSYDNALAESTIGLYKTELVHPRGPWHGIEDLEIATLEYIDWFNHRRLHGALEMVPPAEYEKNFHLAAELEALSADQRPPPVNGKVITSTDRGPRGPAEADRPALLVGAPTGLEQAQ